MGIIYSPKGRAQEYSYKAANFFDGCDHLCSYCWVPDFKKRCGQITSRNEFDTPKLRPGLIEQLKKDAAKYGDNNERVLLCFTCDAYPNDPELRKVTRQGLQIFREYDIPFNVLTKGGTRACRDFDLYGSNDIFSSTLTCLSREKSRRYEPGAALPSDRMDALREAHSRRIRTEVSLEPVLDSQETLAIIRATYNFVDLYKLGKLNYAKTTINWRDFGIEALALLHDLHKPHFVKRDLADHLHGVRFENTDTRMAA